MLSPTIHDRRRLVGLFSKGARMTPISNNPDNAIQSQTSVTSESTTNDQQNPTLTEEQLATQQEEYRKAYLEQLRRQSCPGCGDDGIVPY